MAERARALSQKRDLDREQRGVASSRVQAPYIKKEGYIYIYIYIVFSF